MSEVIDQKEITANSDVVVSIRPSTGWAALALGELWAHREVVLYLGWRDIKVRYKQTVFGASWAIIQPVLTMIVFSVVFGRVAKIPSDGIPYPIFSYAALVPWVFFANSLNKASNSLVGGGNMVKQIYFPRFAIPIASVIGNGLDFLLAMSVLFVMMGIYGIAPTVNIIWLPFLLALALATALGVSLVLSALNVQFRDIKHAVPFVVQLWMFATPVVYPASVIQDPTWRALYSLNPMVGVIEGFRWAMLGTDTAPGMSIVMSAVVALTLLIGGAFYFKRMERTFADVI